MNIEQIYTGCLAQGAYYISSNKEAVIIDPLRETKPYLDRLEQIGFGRINGRAANDISDLARGLDDAVMQATS